MSFDLDVLAADRDADDDLVRAMALRCRSDPHPDSDLDERIVRFYEALRDRYPDQPPFGEATPWAVAPLDVGIDHVTMAYAMDRTATRSSNSSSTSPRSTD